jgi:hypothetical protein
MATTFDLPQSFGVEEFLTTPRLQRHAEDARWLVSTILHPHADRRLAKVSPATKRKYTIHAAIARWGLRPFGS